MRNSLKKFKREKTTDDCMTPPAVYEAVLNWVRKEWEIDDTAIIVRPFWPGGGIMKNTNIPKTASS